MDSSESVWFDLADGTSVVVGSSDYRRVYDELWTLSETPGAISTAALLVDGAGWQHRYEHRNIDLNGPQSAVLRIALDHLEN